MSCLFFFPGQEIGVLRLRAGSMPIWNLKDDYLNVPLQQTGEIYEQIGSRCL
jgi:hypothetical protein